MFECPVCDAEITKENTDRCPECNWQFCACCHHNSPNEPTISVCENNSCRFYGKYLCPDCTKQSGAGWMLFLPGAGVGIGLSILGFLNVQQFENFMWLPFAGVIAICSLIGRLVLGRDKKCPRCQRKVIMQSNQQAEI